MQRNEHMCVQINAIQKYSHIMLYFTAFNIFSIITGKTESNICSYIEKKLIPQ